MKPTFEEVKNNYNKYIFELKNGERAIIVNAHSLKLAEVYELERSEISCDVGFFDERRYNKKESDYDIVKIYKTSNDREYMYHVLNRNSEIEWDWERDSVVEMTLAEVCKALGKEIKIVKE
jgi:hypothetical protein